MNIEFQSSEWEGEMKALKDVYREWFELHMHVPHQQDHHMHHMTWSNSLDVLVNSKKITPTNSKPC